MNKISTLFEMKKALEDLRKAWIDCVCAFDSYGVDCNDYIIGDENEDNEYPFTQSFNDINAVAWIDGCLDRISKDISKKLTFRELCGIIAKHNEENNITQQYQDENPLWCVAVIDNSSFCHEFSLESRSYRFRSDNKYFLSGMGGNSIFCNNLANDDIGVRLDWYLGDWKIEYCYIENENKKEMNN